MTQPTTIYHNKVNLTIKIPPPDIDFIIDELILQTVKDNLF